MIMNDEMLGIVLAGGKGTRLGKLTQNQAKPAVPFGGRYRIIDFTMSNCVNSGIRNIGVITLGIGSFGLWRDDPAAILQSRWQQVVCRNGACHLSKHRLYRQYQSKVSTGLVR